MIYKLNKLCKQVTASEQSNRKQHFEISRAEQTITPGRMSFFHLESEHCPTKKSTLLKKSLHLRLQIINIFILWLCPLATQYTEFEPSLF